MSERWKRSRMAASDDSPDFEAYPVIDEWEPEPLTEIVVGGQRIGVSYGGYDDESELALYPGDYFRQYASAQPERPEAYEEVAEPPLTQAQRDREYLGAANAEAFFEMCRHKRPPGVTGGSKSGKKRTKPVTSRERQARNIVADGDDDRPAVGARVPGSTCIDGLTRGERAVFEAYIPGDPLAPANLAEAVLASLASALVMDSRLVPATEPMAKQYGVPTRNFHVPISPQHRMAFRPFRGAMLAALIDYAHQKDDARIRRIDEGWIEVAESEVAA